MFASVVLNLGWHCSQTRQWKCFDYEGDWAGVAGGLLVPDDVSRLEAQTPRSQSVLGTAPQPPPSHPPPPPVYG